VRIFAAGKNEVITLPRSADSTPQLLNFFLPAAKKLLADRFFFAKWHPEIETSFAGTVLAVSISSKTRKKSEKIL